MFEINPKNPVLLRLNYTDGMYQEYFQKEFTYYPWDSMNTNTLCNVQGHIGLNSKFSEISFLVI